VRKPSVVIYYAIAVLAIALMVMDALNWIGGQPLSFSVAIHVALFAIACWRIATSRKGKADVQNP
jgi:hypothetical protein